MIEVRPFEKLGRFDNDWLSVRYHSASLWHRASSGPASECGDYVRWMRAAEGRPP
jgi:hypothetical protein